MNYLNWLVDNKDKLKTIDGKTIKVFEFRHQKDDAILFEWAKHLRNHYCKDSEIDLLLRGTGFDREEYLIKIKFPDEKLPPGPSISEVVPEI